MNRRIKNKKEKYECREQIKKYPWLLEKTHWYTGKKIPKKELRYDSTWFDAMYNGWRKAFEDNLCADLDDALRRCNCRDNFMLLQVKEKYGALRIYHSGAPEDVERVIDIYSHISEHTCIFCGKFGIPLTNAGWIVPICEQCFQKQFKNISKGYEEFITEKEYDPVIHIRYSKRNKNGGYDDGMIEIDTMPYVRRMKKKYTSDYLKEIGDEV